MDDDPNELAQGRAERVRLHSLDGTSDVIAETTDFVAIYQPLQVGPQAALCNTSDSLVPDGGTHPPRLADC
jgi:hypothetical protein